jgi:hypothetical protein
MASDWDEHIGGGAAILESHILDGLPEWIGTWTSREVGSARSIEGDEHLADAGTILWIVEIGD